MKKRLLIFITTLFFGTACGPSQSNEEVENTSVLPNIIYILVDDMGYGDLSCYGQETLKTPHIDQLAAEGMMFTRHYAGMTVCAPSRASLLTGKHTGHTSVRGNSPPGQLIKPGEVTLPEILAEKGYASAVIGKWGVGHPPALDDPLKNGFDHAYGYINMWHAHNFYPEFLYLNGEKDPLKGNVTDMSYDYRENMPEGTGVAKEKVTYAPDELQRDAARFIDQHKDQPFFLYLALNMPHANNEAGYFTGDGMEVPSYGDYAEKDWPAPEKGFAAMMTYIDDAVGKIMQQLKDQGLDENTLVIFASDNGPHQEGGHKVDYFDSNGLLRGAKRDLYEGGVRVPMITRWPGKVAAGSKTEHISAFWDVLPTFCDLLQVNKPEGIDGISFYPTLIGENDSQEKHKYLYWEFYEQGGKQAVLEDEWKLVKLNLRDPEKEVETELYHLTTDPGEQKNVVDEHPDIVERLSKRFGEAHEPFEYMDLYSSTVNADTKF